MKPNLAPLPRLSGADLEFLMQHGRPPSAQECSNLKGKGPEQASGEIGKAPALNPAPEMNGVGEGWGGLVGDQFL